MPTPPEPDGVSAVSPQGEASSAHGLPESGSTHPAASRPATVEAASAEGVESATPPAAGETTAQLQSSTRGGAQLGAGDLVPYVPEVAEEQLRLVEANARAQAEAELTQAIFSSVVSIRKPRDAIAGVVGGVKNVAVGVGVGVASLVVRPYIGAKSNGPKGFVLGVGWGLGTCVSAVLCGAVLGSVQVVRGIANTPRALLSCARGRRWNKDQRVWERDEYSLEEEVARVLGNGDGATDDRPGGSDSRAPGRPARPVIDNTFYELLGVPADATELEIRRAFYKRSRDLHPDKNPDNPEATQLFQQVNEAYRVLGNQDSRRLYDERGRESAMAGLQKIEPSVFFAAIFGSHHFEPFVGRLRLAQDVDGDLESLLRDIVPSSEDMAPQEIDALKIKRARERVSSVQLEREVKLSVELVKRLSTFVDAAPEQRKEALAKFEEESRAEVRRLAQVTCGVETLALVGWLYVNCGKRFFAGNILGSWLARMRCEAHSAKSKAKLVSSVGRTLYAAYSAFQAEERKRKVEETRSRNPSAAQESTPQTESAETTAQADATEPAAEATPESANVSGMSRERVQKQEEPADGGIPKQEVDTQRKEDSTVLEADGPGDLQVPQEHLGPDATTFSNDQAAPEPPSAENQQELRPGNMVVLGGLRTATELNDQIGVVVGTDPSSGRYVVQILPDGQVKSLKRENLTFVGDPSGADDFAPWNYSSSSSPQADGDAPGGGNAGPEPGQWAPPGGDPFKDCAALAHDALWNATVMDIEYTLTSVTRRILRDRSVDKVVRRLRAEALWRLGRIMLEPMEEARRRGRHGSTPAAGGEGGAASPRAAGRAPCCMPRGSAAERRALAARAREEKQLRFSTAAAMMAAGASSDDIDEMVRAMAAMHASGGGGGSGDDP
eukprot:TRINITY_DN14036_c0_g1_i2.p1 TRINITY_DN14036_c0_g1~~TRINITY_DN14036_c0_g1_i2.p1  ORF type:complete len:896 (+),score=164.92 TRINITY_DN14036_c0_g1_i2:99-2786(+)